MSVFYKKHYFIKFLWPYIRKLQFQNLRHGNDKLQILLSTHVFPLSWNFLEPLFSYYPNSVLFHFDERCNRLTTDNLHSLNRLLQELPVTDRVTSLRTAASRRIDWKTEEVSLNKAKQTGKTWYSTICFCRRSWLPWFFSRLVLSY